jgi:transcriptional regulator with XRE-family HTH domain
MVYDQKALTGKIALLADAEKKPVTLAARNLAYLMNKKGVDAAALSDAIGLGIATVNSLRRGVGNPTLSTLISLAHFFNVSLSELIEIDLAGKEHQLSSAKTMPLIRINDVMAFLEQKLERHATYTTEVEGEKASLHFAVLVNNDSLYPHFSAGTIFIIAQDEKPCDGDIVLVKVGTHSPCLRKVLIDGDHYLFSSVALEGEIVPSLYDDYQVLGTVLKAIKSFS